MLELAAIFTTGGLLLFYKAFCTLKFDIIDKLIKKILIQDKSGEDSYFEDPYRIKWSFANPHNLVIVLVYREMFQVNYIQELIEIVKNSYVQQVLPQVQYLDGIIQIVPNFEQQFLMAYQQWQIKTQKLEKKQQVMRTFNQTKMGQEIQKQESTINNNDNNNNNKKKEGGKVKSNDLQMSHIENTKDEEKDNEIEANRLKLKQRFSKQRTNSDENIVKKLVDQQQSQQLSSKKSKILTDWGYKQNINKKDLDNLDVSQKISIMGNLQENDKLLDEQLRKTYIEGGDKEIEGFYNSDSDSDKEKNQKQKKNQSLWGKIQGSIKNLTGNKVMEEGEVKEILQKVKEMLMSKNVAEEIAQKLCESMQMNLLDKKTAAFTSVYQTVKESMKESLTKILTTNREIDIIKEAMQKRSTHKPYVMVFIGVNGVGKSTNLAKVAYLFKNQGFKVMLAACDNFRAGAVEQIKQHGRCLDVKVFDKGYKDDPALIAQQAIKEATNQQYDVVLIDTAGRMQDNEPLMQALSRLVVLNQPDLITFIGEALTGNDAVDQLLKFNKSLVDLSPKNHIRQIDCMILSKFDTVNDKVGAAISMTYTTGKPILFVGVGQKYPHLKKLNVKTVVHALLD